MQAVADAWIAPDWPAPAAIRALTTTRRLPGNSAPPFEAFNLGLRGGEDAGIVRANRELLARAFALPSAPRWLHQVHGNRSLRLSEEISADEPEADAAFTVQLGVVLSILSADCMPILVCAKDGREVAAIHAGWRGLALGVIGSCLGRMRTPPANLLVWLGPAIGAVSYEVGDDVRSAFVTQSESARDAFVASRPAHWHCDLYALARQQLAALGVTQIHGGGFDTFADPRFYSYRRDAAHSGRFASLIWIQP